jgi:6-pyruvoyltetrahydropterin/6-carboxytetrahydropterin synthase
MEIAYRFGFDAAHRFEGFPEGHPYRGIHGHSFQAEVALEGELDPATGFVADLGELEKACRDVREKLDHRMLNDGRGPFAAEPREPVPLDLARARAAIPALVGDRAPRLLRPAVHLSRP